MNKLTLPFILYFIDEKYRSRHSKFIDIESDFNWQEIKKYSIANKVFYWLIQNVKSLHPHLLSNLITTEELIELTKEVRLFEKTVLFADSALRKSSIQYLLVKSYKNVGYVTQDIDIFVQKDSFRTAIKALKEYGATRVKLSLPNEIVFTVLYQPEEIYTAKNILKIDMYRDLSWIRLPAFGYDFLWDNPIRVNISNINTAIPNPEADLVSLLAHSLFWHGDLLLLDFLYLTKLMDSPLDWERMFMQADKYGWKRGLLRLMNALVNTYDTLLYQDYKDCNVSFPFRIRFLDMLKNYREFIASSNRCILPLVYMQVLFQMLVLCRERTRKND